MSQLLGHPADALSAVAAITAVGVSIAALGLALCTAWLQRTHNRLSVRPLAEILFRDMDGHIRVRLHNNGTGPLIVNKFRVLKPGHPTVSSLIQAIPDEQTHWSFFAGNIDGRSIRPGSSINLLDLSYEMGGAEELRATAVRVALQHLVVRVSYLDIYQRKMPAYKKSLEWFGRML